MLEGLDDLGHGLGDVAALVLTHGHVDHIGFAERVDEITGGPVLAHEADAGLATGAETGSASEVVWNLWRPAVLKLLFELGRNGGLSVPPVEQVETFEDDAVLSIPGHHR